MWLVVNLPHSGPRVRCKPADHLTSGYREMLSCFCSRTLITGFLMWGWSHLPLVTFHLRWWVSIRSWEPRPRGVERRVFRSLLGMQVSAPTLRLCVSVCLAPAPGLPSHRLMLMSLVLTQALLKLPLASETRAPGFRLEALSTFALQLGAVDGHPLPWPLQAPAQ